MDELRMTVDSLIELDEPEALLETLRRAAARKKGERWSRLALALSHAQDIMDKVDVTPASAPASATDAPDDVKAESE